MSGSRSASTAAFLMPWYISIGAGVAPLGAVEDDAQHAARFRCPQVLRPEIDPSLTGT